MKLTFQFARDWGQWRAKSLQTFRNQYSRGQPNGLRFSSPNSRFISSRQDVLVGGVNSPVRAFRAVGGDPLIIDRAQGSRIFDIDGREYLDYVGSWGAMILGHAHDAVTASMRDQSSRGTSYGMTNRIGNRAGGENPLGPAFARNGPLRQLRHGSDDERGAPGARLHAARPDSEIRGLLSRPRRTLFFRMPARAWPPSGSPRVPACRIFSRTSP